MRGMAAVKFTPAEAGLTFLELIFTVLLLATLASIAMLNYGELQQDTVRELAGTDLKVIRAALRSYYLDHGTFPDNLARLVEVKLLDAVPDDKFLDGSGTKYHYQLMSASSAKLWSVGPNRVDNTGLADDEVLQVSP